MSEPNNHQPEPGTDMPVMLIADGRMMDLSGRACNIVVQFVYPDTIGCSTIAAMHIRPHDGLADACVNDDIDERSRVKFARFLETIARVLRHYKPGQAGIEDIPGETA